MELLAIIVLSLTFNFFFFSKLSSSQDVNFFSVVFRFFFNYEDSKMYREKYNNTLEKPSQISLYFPAAEPQNHK